MTNYEGEIVTLSEGGGVQFQAIRRGYELKTKSVRPGETIFTALGEYAIGQLQKICVPELAKTRSYLNIWI